jgi:hypothetical protein
MHNYAPMDTKKILESIRSESDRKKVSLYLSESLFEKFKDSCGGVSASRVLEALMKDFIEKLHKEKKDEDSRNK